MPFDPFGDFASRGYLRNTVGEQDADKIARYESRAFKENILPALESLRAVPKLDYGHVLQTNKILFDAVYPWAGQDRLVLAPDAAIGKAGHYDLFAHPRDIKRAAEHGLNIASDGLSMRERPGEIFGLLAYAHPFLETNGRTIMAVHADLTRRAGFHIAWDDIGKGDFLQALTDELRRPGGPLDELLRPHIRPGVLDLSTTTLQLAENLGLNADRSEKSKGVQETEAGSMASGEVTESPINLADELRAARRREIETDSMLQGQVDALRPVERVTKRIRI